MDDASGGKRRGIERACPATDHLRLYRDFIQYLLDAHAYTWFAKLIAYGELILGIALVIGAFVGCCPRAP